MQCLDSAHKHGLSDMSLLQEIGETYAQQGRFHEASCCLQKVVAQPQFATYRAFAMLGEAYVECKEPKAAKAAWASALSMAVAPCDIECAKAALSATEAISRAADANGLTSPEPAEDSVEIC